ncbi:MAG: polysaccharide biosynthesis protein [Candidatus Izemoplasmatales bacterium]
MKKIGNYLKRMKMFQFVLIDIIDIAVVYAFAILGLQWMGVSDFDAVFAFKILPVVILFKIIVYYILRLYQLVLDNVGLDEVFRISVGVILTNVIIGIVFLSIADVEFIPEVYLIFTTFAELIFLMFPRVVKRMLKVIGIYRAYPNGKRTLLIGAGAGGKLVLNEIRDNPELTNNVIAFVDDDPEKIGKLMSGFKVFGPITKTPELIDLLNIEEVIIAIANIESERFQEIIEIIAEKPVKIKRLPRFKDLQKDAPKKLLEVNVEDLLSREVIELDDQGIHDFIKGKKVLVTGAGGSIGSELVRQIIRNQPSEILLVDIYENGVYDLQMELNRLFEKNPELTVTRKVLIGSVYNFNRMKEIFEMFQPNMVFHAAAYKHVPLMEDSAKEAIRTNVIGTYNVCKLASIYHVEKMLLVSSDKAVRPTNVMGATKRFAEMIMQYFNSISDTSYSAVRFGNVLGSNGSVVPLFRKQIEDGGPVTVTDKEIIRYFMTIPEAVGLILQSATYASGGEIFILDMGEPVKIYDLAEKMIMLSGLRPHKDIEIKITGLRPGEKLYEELLVDQDNHNIKTENRKIFIEAKESPYQIEEQINKIVETFESLQNVEIKEMIHDFVPTYTIKK